MQSSRRIIGDISENLASKTVGYTIDWRMYLAGKEAFSGLFAELPGLIKMISKNFSAALALLDESKLDQDVLKVARETYVSPVDLNPQFFKQAYYYSLMAYMIYQDSWYSTLCEDKKGFMEPLFYVPDSLVSRPRFMILLDHFNKNVVIVVRGTSVKTDILTDLTLAAIEISNQDLQKLVTPELVNLLPPTEAASLSEDVRDKIKMHSGFYHGAVNILTKSGFEWSSLYLTAKNKLFGDENRWPEIVVTGHSLGASTAGAITCILRSQNFQARGILFAPAPFLSVEASKLMMTDQYITAFVNRWDIVTRLETHVIIRSIQRISQKPPEIIAANTPTLTIPGNQYWLYHTTKGPKIQSIYAIKDKEFFWAEMPYLTAAADHSMTNYLTSLFILNRVAHAQGSNESQALTCLTRDNCESSAELCIPTLVSVPALEYKKWKPFSKLKEKGAAEPLPLLILGSITSVLGAGIAKYAGSATKSVVSIGLSSVKWSTMTVCTGMVAAALELNLPALLAYSAGYATILYGLRTAVLGLLRAETWHTATAVIGKNVRSYLNAKMVKMISVLTDIKDQGDLDYKEENPILDHTQKTWNYFMDSMIGVLQALSSAAAALFVKDNSSLITRIAKAIGHALVGVVDVILGAASAIVLVATILYNCLAKIARFLYRSGRSIVQGDWMEVQRILMETAEDFKKFLTSNTFGFIFRILAVVAINYLWFSIVIPAFLALTGAVLASAGIAAGSIMAAPAVSAGVTAAGLGVAGTGLMAALSGFAMTGGFAAALCILISYSNYQICNARCVEEVDINFTESLLENEKQKIKCGDVCWATGRYKINTKFAPKWVGLTSMSDFTDPMWWFNRIVPKVITKGLATTLKVSKWALSTKEFIELGKATFKCADTVPRQVVATIPREPPKESWLNVLDKARAKAPVFQPITQKIVFLEEEPAMEGMNAPPPKEITLEEIINKNADIVRARSVIDLLIPSLVVDWWRENTAEASKFALSTERRSQEELVNAYNFYNYLLFFGYKISGAAEGTGDFVYMMSRVVKNLYAAANIEKLCPSIHLERAELIKEVGEMTNGEIPWPLGLLLPAAASWKNFTLGNIVPMLQGDCIDPFSSDFLILESQ
jgi:hypothetical protein